jgi:hypothetical protein
MLSAYCIYLQERKCTKIFGWRTFITPEMQENVLEIINGQKS